LKYLIFSLMITFLSGCVSEKKESVSSQAEDKYPDQVSWDATILITKQANRLGLLKAGKIEKYSRENITLLKDNIKVDFFNEQGDHTSVLTAKGGKVFDLTQNMLAYGNVVVESDSGMTLFTDTLRWDHDKQKIISDVPIMITTLESDTLYGDSFISDPNLKNRKIVNPRGKSVKSIKID